MFQRRDQSYYFSMKENQIICGNAMKGKVVLQNVGLHDMGSMVFCNYLLIGLQGFVVFDFKKSVSLCIPAGPGTWAPPALVF